MTFDELKKALNEYEINCDEKQLSLLNDFMNETLSANEKFNLTAIKDPNVFVEKMILDSALALYDVDLKDQSLIDVGTGAGYPGMVLRILSNNANIYLLDSTKKKIDYLADFANKKELKVNCVNARAEEYARENREAFDFATARAVAPLNILLEIVTPLLKVNGTFIALKGADYEQEINESKNALKKMNCKVSKIYEFELPESKEKRAIIHIKKLDKTNKKYPREYKDIKRLPL